MMKLVFRAQKWNEAGGDVGDNSQFWEPAEILYTYAAFGDGELVARVRWEDGTESGGHIISCMKEISKSVPLTTAVDNVRKVVGSATISKDGTITAVIMDDETWDQIKAPGPFSIGDDVVRYPTQETVRGVRADIDRLFKPLDKDELPENLTVEHGMVHYPAHNPKTTAPTGECGQMGFALELCTDLNEVTCPQCKKIIEGD